jgi:hypothetical protein
MKIISHRGYWKVPAEKNTVEAFRRSFDLGFGTETDFRDLAGKLVVSHDPPTGGEMSADALFDLMRDRSLPMALNIKADGNAAAMRDAALRAGLSDWFVFDMSVPDTLMHLKLGNPVFGRLSELEPDGPLVRRCPGIWLDAFEGRWFGTDLIEALLARGQRVCLVSPELHKRAHLDFWSMLKPLASREGLILCTDLPENAASFLEVH